MAGNTRGQPIELILAKGNKAHKTKAEIKERMENQIKAPADKVAPPKFLSKKQKELFDEIAEELIKLDIFSNLDCNLLGMYIKAFDLYSKVTKELEKTSLEDLSQFKELTILHEKYAKECRMLASDLGLSISSRCKLVIPKAPEPKKNKFDKFG